MATETIRFVLLITVSLLYECTIAVSTIAVSPLEADDTGIWQGFKDGFKSMSGLHSETLSSYGGCRVGVFSFQGALRIEMKDRYSTMKGDVTKMTGFAVYAGHYDAEVANSAQKGLLSSIIVALTNKKPEEDASNVISNAIVQFDKKILNMDFDPRSGSTALIGILHDQYLYIANLGDSRAVAHRSDTNASWTLTTDHVPSSGHETERIQSMGGAVTKDGLLKLAKGPPAMRVPPIQASRSLGDRFFKPFIVLSLPTVTKIEWKKESIDYVVLGTPGLWKVMSAEQVVDTLAQFLDGEKRRQGTGNLLLKAILKSPTQDATAVVVKMPTTTNR